MWTVRMRLTCGAGSNYMTEVQDQRVVDFGLFLSFLKDGRGFHLGKML